MSQILLDEDWLIHSRTCRKTKTVRIDIRLLEETKNLGIKRGQFSDILNLAQAVAIATAHNRDYQSQKEALYLSALGLTLERHKYARQWLWCCRSHR